MDAGGQRATHDRSGGEQVGHGADPRSSAPPRVRVTSAASSGAASATRGIALPGAPVREAEAVYVRSLVRGQLRLALGCLLAFLLVAAVLTVAIFVVAGTGDPVVFGVPLSWLLQAYGYYPIMLVFAVVFARAAGRNERRYRALAEHDAGESGAMS